MMFCVRSIWADDTALNSSCDKPSDLSQQALIWSLKYENAEILENVILDPAIYSYLENYLQANPFWLKIKNTLRAWLLLEPLLNN